MMKALISTIVVAAFIWLILALMRSKSAGQEPVYATRDQIPSIVSKLQRTGQDGSFVVFMFSLPGSRDETLPNLQYSIENSRLGFDWVLIAPQNVKDEMPMQDFIKRQGYTPLKREVNDVRYIRVEGKGVDDLSLKVLRDFYQLPPELKLELIVEGFDMKDDAKSGDARDRKKRAA